jgi:hypothetical protein
MRHMGLILLTLWAGFHLVTALVRVLVFANFGFGKEAPALVILLGYADNPRVGYRDTATIYASTVMGQAGIAAVCGLSLAVIWRALVKGEPWAFVALLTCLGFLQAAAFVSDEFVGNTNFTTNVVSAAVLLLGLGWAACGIRHNRPAPPMDGIQAPGP